MPRFIAAYPGITINLTTRLVPFDFQKEALDAAIHFGKPDWPEAELDFLLAETVVPACSPGLLVQYGFVHAVDLVLAPLLHLISRPDAWERWFKTMGVDIGEVHGMLVDQFAVAAQAAISGLGVALLPRFLIEDELKRGDLVEAVPGPVESTEHYYLAWPSRRATHAPLQSFREWLRMELG